jgi:ABC-type uncharacterized transport system involved in gliding motility auxiliary subunit
MKRISPFLPYLFWLGPMLIIAGLSAGVVAGTWNAIPMGMILAGLAIAGLGLIRLSRGVGGQPKFWNRRATEAGANALVGTIAILAILGLVNFLAVKNVGRLDLTENQQFTLAPQTQELTRSLKEPLKVWVFDPQQQPQDRELLESYRRLNPQLSYQFADPQADPNLASRLGVKSFGDVVLELQPDKRKQFVQRVGNAQDAPQGGGRLSEVKLTNAIEQIISDRRNTAYFLQGHGERALEAGTQGAMSQAMKSLGEKNFVAKPLNLAERKDFPLDANVVVVAGPQKPLLAAEVKALQTYLDQGGNLLLLVDPTNAEPKLTDLLNEWGITLDKRVAIDGTGAGKALGLGPADVLVTQYGNHPITKELQGSFSFFSLARPIEVKPVPGVKSEILLYTNEQSWAESDLQAKALEFNPPKDLKGPLALGVALARPVNQAGNQTGNQAGNQAPTKPNATPERKTESRLVVIGNSTFAADNLFDKAVNGDVFLNSLNWLSQQDNAPLSIRAKEAKNRRINMTPQQVALSGWLAIAILPLLGFGTAIFIWWRRR